MRRVAYGLSLLLIFAIPWEKMITTGSQVSTMARLLGLVVAAVWVGTVIFTGKFRKPHPLHIAVFLYVIWNAVTLLWTVDVGLTTGRLETYVQLFAMAVIIWDLYTTPEALRAGLQAYVLGAYVTIAGTVANYLSQPNSEGFRYAAAGFGENQIGVIMALGIPVAWYLNLPEFERKRTPAIRLLNYLYAPAALLVILLSGSRAGIIATLPGLFFIIWSLKNLSLLRRVLAFAVLTSLLLALPSLAPQTAFERLAAVRTSAGQVDLGSRAEIFRAGLDVFLEHPITGAGSGAFRPASEQSQSPHSSFLALLAEQGIIGFGIFSAVMVMAIHYGRYQPKLRSRLWLAILFIWIIHSLAHEFLHLKQPWVFLSFVIVGAGLNEGRMGYVSQTVRRGLERVSQRPSRPGPIDRRHGHPVQPGLNSPRS